MYRESGSRIPGVVAWLSRSTIAGTVYPDGCMDMIWTGEKILVAGPDTGPHPVLATGALFTGLRFTPGLLPCVLGVPAIELRDQRVDLADLLPRGVVTALYTHASWDAQGAVEQFTGARLQESQVAGWVGLATRALATGVGVASVAAGIGWSERQFRRASLTAFGYGPKQLARILRFRRALTQAQQSDHPLRCIAAEQGYADEAHLCRDVKALTGESLTQIRARQSAPAEPQSGA